MYELVHRLEARLDVDLRADYRTTRNSYTQGVRARHHLASFHAALRVGLEPAKGATIDPHCRRGSIGVIANLHGEVAELERLRDSQFDLLPGDGPVEDRQLMAIADRTNAVLGLG